MEINVDKKREEIIQMWLDSIEMVKTDIQRIKAGDKELRGAFLGELNKFLNASRNILKELEAEQMAAEQAKSLKQTLGESASESDEEAFQASLEIGFE